MGASNRDAEIIAVTAEINRLLDDLSATVSALNQALIPLEESNR